MADVTGDIGGQPVQLNNAATEATLKQLLAAMQVMAKTQIKKGQTDAKAQKDYEKELKKLAQQAKKTAEEQKKFAEETKKAREAQEAAAKALEERTKAEEEAKKKSEALGEAFAGLGKIASGVALGMTNLISSLANTGNSLTAAAQSLNAIPVVGGVLAGVFGAVAGAADKTYKSFQQAASVGATFGGSISDMVNAAGGAGLTFEQFSGIVQRNSQALAMLGGSTETGAKRLAQLGKGIKDSALGDQLARLGYSTEAINEGLATHASRLQKTGQLQGMNDAQLIESTGKYLQNLDAVSKLTGQNKKDLEAEREARMRDAQYRMTLSKLDAKSKENLEALMDSIPAEHRQGMQEIIATGTATSEAGKAALAFLPESARGMMQLNQQIRTTGKVSEQNARSLNATYQEENKKLAKSGLGETLALYGDDAQKKFMVGAMDVAARTKNLAQVQEETAKAQANASKDLNPADLKKAQEQIAQVSNKFTLFLAQSGLLESMMTAFGNLAGFVETFVVPSFQFMASNFDGIAAVAAPLVAGFLALKAVMAVQRAMEVLRTAGIIAQTTAMGPFVLAAIAVAAAIAGLVYVTTKITKYFGGLGMIIESVKDAFSKLVLGFKSIINGILVKIPNKLGGISEEEYKKRQEAIEAEEKTIEERGKQRDKAREEARKEAESSKKVTEQKKEEAKATEKANAEKAKAEEPKPQLDFSTPEKLLESSLKRQKKIAEDAATAPGAESKPAAAPAGPRKELSQNQQQNMALIEDALKKQGIKDPAMIAAIKGNVMKETGGKSISENLDYSKTSNERIRKIFGSRAAGKSDAELDAIKKDPKQMGEMMYGSGTKLGQQMGNTEPGDGFKYRGRGFIQLTGKANYAAASKAIYNDDRLVKDPDLVNQPDVAAQVSAWFMKKTSGSMAKSMGIDMNNMSQEQANLVATSAIAGKDVRKMGAYGQELQTKVAAYATDFQGSKAVTPTTSTALSLSENKTTAPGKMSQQEADRAAQQKALAEAEKRGPDRLNLKEKAEVAGMKAGPSQESAESLLAQLNTKMDTLIRVSSRTAELNDRQLSVQQGLTGNLFAA